MLPICDTHGALVAWLKDEVIFGLNGAALAYLKDENVINFAGAHCGFLKNGFFRDHEGNVAAFMRGAAGGPITPPVKIPPPAPPPGIVPIRPPAPIPPPAAMPTYAWSKLFWDAYIAAILRPAPPPPKQP